MDIKEFRQKYPQYNDMNDSQLAESFYTKYYSDMPKEKFMQSFIGTTAPDPTAESKEPGFFGRVNESLVRRGVNIAEELTPTQDESFGETLRRAPGRAFRTTGQVAGFVGDVVSEAIGTGVKSLKPAIVGIAGLGMIPIVETAPQAFKGAVGEAVSRVSEDPRYKPFIEGVSGPISKFKSENPETWKNLEAGANILSVGLAGKPARALSQTAKEAAEAGAGKIVKSLTKTPEALDKELKSSIRQGIEKSIRPGVEGKRTFGTTERFYKNAQNAVENIVLNKNNLKLTDDIGEAIEGLPKNLKQFSQAVSQTKQQIFREYDSMAKATGQTGATVGLASVSNELKSVAESVVLRDNAPGVSAYAKQLAETYAKRGSYTAEQAQEAIAHFNNTLEAFYKNPSYDTASKAYIDSLVVNNLRKSLDNVIESATGPGYQNLKKAYGSLKAIERDVNRRAIVDARKNVKGLIDFSDVFSGGAAVHGILAMNPAIVGEAVAAKGIARLYKYLNDPNRIVKNMFEKTEKVLDKKGMISNRPLTDVIKSTEKQTKKQIATQTAKQEMEKDIGTVAPIAAKAAVGNNERLVEKYKNASPQEKREMLKKMSEAQKQIVLGSL